MPKAYRSRYSQVVSQSWICPPVVIFCRPQSEGNVGALSRVMANLGCQELRLVGEIPEPENLELSKVFLNTDWALATGAGQKILHNAKSYETLNAAIENCQFVLGSSGKELPFESPYHRDFVSPEEAVERLNQGVDTKDSNQRWAFVIGSENDGLNQVEASLCQALIRLDCNPEAPSINAAMAAGLILYHLRCLTQTSKSKNSGSTIAQNTPNNERASADQIESFLLYLHEMLQQTQFFKTPDQNAPMARLRRLFQESSLRKGDLLFLFEILYQLKSWAHGGHQSRDFLSRSSHK